MPRNATIVQTSSLSAVANDDTIKMNQPIIISRLRPKMSPSAPAGRSSAASTMA
jgi:hypothetical protein